VTLWESRTLPDFFYKKGRLLQAPLFYFHHRYICM